MIALVVFVACFATAFAGEQQVDVSQDTLGNYNLRYAIEGISRVEQGDAHGNVNGAFSYIDPYGIVRKTEFTSGVHGYNAVSADIPVPVQDTPEVAITKANHLAALHAAYLQPKLPEFQGPEEGFIPSTISFGPARIAAPIPRLVPALHALPAFPPAPQHVFGFPSVAPLPLLHGHLGVGETPEVLAARAEHFAAHAAAKARLLH